MEGVACCEVVAGVSSIRGLDHFTGIFLMPDQQILTRTFPNGLTVIVEPMADVQSAAFSLMIPAGAIYDQPGREGCASVLVDWVTRGAGPRDSQQLTNDLDNLGLSRNENAGSTHLSFGGAALAENLFD